MNQRNRRSIENARTPAGFLKSALADGVRLAQHPRQTLSSLYGVSLYRNAGYLMAGTAVTSVTGFFFWMAAARLFPVEAVGLGSAIISAIGLLALFSELGLGIGLIRYLPGAGRGGNDMINTCFTLSGLASIVIALIFLAGLDLWSPALVPVRQHPVFFAAFVLFTAAAVLQPLVGNTFMARLNTRFIVIKSVIFGLLRIALLALFAVFFAGSFGVVLSQGLAMAVGVLAAALLLLPKVQDGYRPFPKIDTAILGQLRSYAGANYVARLLLQMSPLVLPLVVLNILGAELNAYFYIAWTIAMALKAVPSAVFNSLFAEGSNDEASLRRNAARSLKFMLLLLLPLTLVVLIAAEWLLLLFGQAYAANAALLLRIVALAVTAWGINYLYVSIERVRKNTRGIIAVAALATGLSLGLSHILMMDMGLIGAGIGYLGGQAVVAVGVGIVLWRRYRFRREDREGRG